MSNSFSWKMVAHHDHQQLPQQGGQARKGMQEKLSGQRLAGAVTRTTRTSLMQPPVDGQHLKVLEFPPSKVPPSKMQKTSSNFDLANMTAWKLTKQTDNMRSKRMIRLHNAICDKYRKRSSSCNMMTCEQSSERPSCEVSDRNDCHVTSCHLLSICAFCNSLHNKSLLPQKRHVMVPSLGHIHATAPNSHGGSRYFWQMVER